MSSACKYVAKWPVNGSWALTLVVVAALLSGCASLRAARQDRVTIDLYSGRADNPTWMLSPTESRLLRDKVATLPPLADAHPAEGNLGYRGLWVELPGKRGATVERLRAFQGMVTWERGGEVAASYSDPQRAFERWLLETGSGRLDPSVRDMIRSAIEQP